MTKLEEAALRYQKAYNAFGEASEKQRTALLHGTDADFFGTKKVHDAASHELDASRRALNDAAVAFEPEVANLHKTGEHINCTPNECTVVKDIQDLTEERNTFKGQLGAAVAALELIKKHAVYGGLRKLASFKGQIAIVQSLAVQGLAQVQVLGIRAEIR